MFWSYLQFLSIRKLGFGKPILIVFVAIVFCCLIAGFVYAAFVFHAVTERNQAPHVQPHSSH